MKKTAFLFPGQGAQAIGMGADFYSEYDVVRETFDMVDEIMSAHISRLCFKGPMEDLTKTVWLQPAVTTVNLAILSVLSKEGLGFDYTAGHSLGEYSSLACAGVVSPANALRLVKCRGELMHRESVKYRGAMSAVIGLDIDTVAAVAKDIADNASSEYEGVYVANHNAEKQIVVSGSPAAVKEFSTRIRTEGGRALPLNVSGAWHSRLISGAENEFERFVRDFDFVPSGGRVVYNVTARPASSTEEIKDNLVKQICSTVRWYDTMNCLIENGVEAFIEVGPGNVLAGLAKKIVPAESEISVYSVNDMKSLEAVLKECS